MKKLNKVHKLKIETIPVHFQRGKTVGYALVQWCISTEADVVLKCVCIFEKKHKNTMIPVCNEHLYNKIYYLWFIQ